MTHQAMKAVLLLIGVVLASINLAKAQETKHLVAVIGAPEEPRFSDIVSGLKKGLGELGYEPPALLIHETKIARAEKKNAKSLITA